MSTLNRGQRSLVEKVTFLKFCFSMTVCIQPYFVLVSGVQVTFLKDLNKSERMSHEPGWSDQTPSLPGSRPGFCSLFANRAPFLSSKCPTLDDK